jgi:DNA-binding MarR family transcriptional regulator
VPVPDLVWGLDLAAGLDGIGSPWYSSICDDLQDLMRVDRAMTAESRSVGAHRVAAEGAITDSGRIEPDAHAQAVRSAVRSLAGDADPTGMMLMRLVRVVANQYDTLEEDQLRASGMSGQRWGLLLRLLVEERCAGADGASPTYLSRCQNVSKNTISSLLRGLEEQGLVERTLDSTDRRAFRIRLTEAGRELVQRTAPEHILFLNDLTADLSVADRAALIGLLERLHRSLLEQQPRGPA